MPPRPQAGLHTTCTSSRYTNNLSPQTILLQWHRVRGVAPTAKSIGHKWISVLSTLPCTMSRENPISSSQNVCGWGSIETSREREHFIHHVPSEEGPPAFFSMWYRAPIPSIDTMASGSRSVSVWRMCAAHSHPLRAECELKRGRRFFCLSGNLFRHRSRNQAADDTSYRKDRQQLLFSLWADKGGTLSGSRLKG